MTTGSPLGLLVQFSIPLIIGNLFQQLYAPADRVIVGQFVGSDAFCSVGTTFAPSNMFASVCIGMSSGAGIVVAQYFGAGEKENIAKSIANSAYINILLAVITSVVGIICARPFLSLLNTPDELMEDAVSYMQIYLGGLTAVSAYYTPFSIIRALGDSKAPLIFLVTCSLLNIVLDLIFVIPLGMGVKGAAIATILAQIISAVMCIVYSIKKIEYIRIAFKYSKLDMEMMKQTIRVGMPVAVQYSLMYLSTVVLQSVVNDFGKSAIGAYTAVSQMELLVLEIFNGISAAVMTYSGQNIGAGKTERIGEGLKSAARICAVAAVILFVFFLIGGNAVMGIFVKDDNITQIAAKGICISGTFFFACGINRVMLNLLCGAGDSSYAIINGGTEIAACIGFVYLLTAIPMIGLWSIFLTTGMTWLTTMIIGMVRYKKGGWKQKSII